VEGPYHQELAEPLEHPLLDTVPAEARRTARAAGLEPLILALLKAQGPALELERLSLRQTLWLRLGALETQLQSLLSEVECTDDVVEDLRDTLEQREHARELKLTLASLVVAAVAATAAGAWELSDHGAEGAAITGIAGGVSSAALGVAALIPRRQLAPYSHVHNLLTPIVSGADPERFYPTFARRLLAAPQVPGGKAPREELLVQFEHSIAASYPESERPAARKVLYGAGGVYDHRLIDLREGMYDALESKLSTFARDLELLSRYLVNLSGATPE
jgi:hypothetical protein